MADTVELWVQLCEKEKKETTPHPVEEMHATCVNLKSSYNVDELFKYVVEKTFKSELDGFSSARLKLYYKTEDDTLQECKKYSMRLEELHHHTQCNEDRPLWIVRPKESQSSVSVTFEIVYGAKKSRIERTINSRNELSMAYLRKLTFDSTIKFPDGIAETDLSFVLGDKKESAITLVSDEDVKESIWRRCVSADRTLRLQIETRQKPFSDWKFSDIKTLYNLYGDTIQALDKFEPGITDISAEIRPKFNHLVEEIQTCLKAFQPVPGSYEANRSEFISRILSSVTGLFDGRFKLYPQMELAGQLGKGPVDWAIKYGDGRIIGVTEAKREDLNQGVAQNIIQLQSSKESNKRKLSDVEDISDTLFGIVTTAEEWVLLKVEQSGGEYKVYIDDRGRYFLDLSDNVDPVKLAAGLEELFKRLLWVYEQSLPVSESKKRKTSQI